MNKEEMYAWGNEISVEGYDIWSADIETAEHLTTKRLDPSTDLYYFHARWYDGETGQFVSNDSINEYPFTKFSYSNNSPTNLVDSTGLETCEDPKVPLWKCRRYFISMWIPQIGPLSHSYICCTGPGENCYGAQRGGKKGEPIPREKDAWRYDCEAECVCPKDKEKACNNACYESDYNIITNNCHRWANKFFKCK